MPSTWIAWARSTIPVPPRVLISQLWGIPQPFRQRMPNNFTIARRVFSSLYTTAGEFIRNIGWSKLSWSICRRTIEVSECTGLTEDGGCTPVVGRGLWRLIVTLGRPQVTLMIITSVSYRFESRCPRRKWWNDATGMELAIRTTSTKSLFRKFCRKR
jgi:hypothetical protein